MSSEAPCLVFGKGSLAIHAAEILLSSGRSLVGVIPPATEPDWSASVKDWAAGNGTRIFKSCDAALAANPDIGLGVSVFHDRIFTAGQIARFQSLVNLHNGPLPRYRGVRPINWALKNGERSHGVTLHDVSPGIDSGDVIAQMLFGIDPVVDEVEDVYARCLAAGRQLLDACLPDIEGLPRYPQDDAASTYYSEADAPLLAERLDWRRP